MTGAAESFREFRFSVARRIPAKLARLKAGAPLVSFTFDDFPRSAWTVGGPILERFGVKATYFPVGAFCGGLFEDVAQYTLDDLRTVHAAGHEIGCHSFSHPHPTDVAPADLAADIARNAAFLREALGADFTPSSFAHPYGETNGATKRLAGRTFASARGIRPGVNGALTDLAQLKAAPLESRSWSAPAIEARIAAAVAAGGWLVFFSHGVDEDPTPYGCTPAMLEHALTCALNAGMTVLPVKHALAAATFR